jgi:plasmid stabilization system protein ParE
MSHRVFILRKAEADLRHFLDWLSERSVAGAERWYAAYLHCVDAIAADPRSFPLLDEHPSIQFPVHECFFGTPRGRRYRMLFVVIGSDVRILRIRGPGQSPVSWNDLL